MEPAFLEEFRIQLGNWMKELLGEAERTRDGMNSDNKGTFPDPADRASMESTRNFTLRIRDRERKLITKIQEALNRIEEGTFGICEVCGGEISVGRLRARPVTTLCIECKETQEAEEQKAT